MKRRELLGAGAALSVLNGMSRPALGSTLPRSNREFLFGAATAGHQVEGNNTNSDIWFLENIKPTKFAVRSGDACDSYHRFEEDIQLLKSFGLDCYRFSIEWSRIEPSSGKFSNAELAYYLRVIETCHKYGVRPVVTFNHFSCPQWFSANGGWTAPDSPEFFARYCDRSARALGDGMHMAATLNEPQVKRLQHWIPAFSTPASNANLARQREAARAASGSSAYMAFHLADDESVLSNLIKAHKLGYAAIKAAVAILPVGVTLAIIDYQAAAPQSRLSEVRDYVNAAWLQAVKETGDFVGVQNYGRDLVGAEGVIAPPASAERNMLT